MKKHLLSFVALLCVVWLTPVRALAFEVGGIYYNVISGSDVEVTKNGSYDGVYAGAITIPETVYIGHTAYRVTRIGDSAFYGCSSLTSIKIPASVTSIADYSFAGCSGLTSIVVAAGNPNYDSREKCNALIETSSNTLKQGCKTTVIPNSVTSIGQLAFGGCTGLTSIEIPASVTFIGPLAFQNCSGLTSIVIPASVTKYGSSAFQGCSGLTSLVVEPGNPSFDSRENCNAVILTRDNRLVEGIKTTVIPNSVTSIGNYAFRGCKGLTSIEIPASVTSIGYQAFEYCSGLTSIEIPASVTSIGERAFGCCTGLTSIEIPNSVISIGSGAFRECTGLTSIEIPNSVTSIFSETFFCCSGLTSIVIPASVTSIGYQAFIGCTGLTSLEIPSSVTSIGGEAFWSCSRLNKVISHATVPPTCSSGDDVWYNVKKSNCTLYVPAGTKPAYAHKLGWSYFYKIQELPALETTDEDVVVTFSSDLAGESDLEDKVVNNTYYNLDNSNGDGYDAIEQGIVLNSTTSAADLEAIAGLDVSYGAVSENYHGLIVQLAAGSGIISVDVKTIGAHILNVKIGDGQPSQISKSERGTVEIPYNVSAPTYVYIYATGSGNSSAPIYRAPSAGANSVILYGYGITLDTTAIDTLDAEATDTDLSDCEIYTAGGQRVDALQAGMNIVRMKNGKVKKIVKL